LSEAIDPEALFKRNPSILFNDFDDGIMMMDIDSGHYFDIDTVGSQIWGLLEEPASLAAVCAQLAQDYEVDDATCLAETGSFFAELAANGLIQPA
jgi:Coenzyme PQQ synthesis protein D (PqqD)